MLPNVSELWSQTSEAQYAEPLLESANTALGEAQAALPSTVAHSAHGPNPVFEQPLPSIKAGSPERYIVKRGDTLWSIASRFLTSPWQWRTLWRHNPQIKNPHLIYPGDVIYKIHRNGKTSLGIQRRGASAHADGLPVVRIQPKIRYQDLAPIPVVPELLISQYATKPMILSQESVDDSGYILADLDGRLISAKGSKLYARAIDRYSKGRTLHVVRLGDQLKDPQSGETLGQEATLVGSAQVRQSGDPSIVAIERHYREILPGDRLVPETLAPPLQQLQATSPDHRFEGRVISVFDGFTRAGENQVISINLGRRDQIKAGDVVAVVSPQKALYDPYTSRYKTAPESVEVPDLDSGVAVIVRSFEKMSYALIMSSSRALRPNDRIVPTTQLEDPLMGHQ